MAVQGWVTPSFPQGSMLIIMSVLGAVVMPHNLFLHSEVIQSHEYNKKDDASIRRVLKYELFDTLFSMIVGWAINSAMILLAAATFFKGGIRWRSCSRRSRCWTVAGQQRRRGVCAGIADGGHLLDNYKRHGGRFHLCRYLRRVVPHQGQPLAGGGNPFVGHRAAVDLFHRRPVQGTADFADDTEHPVAVYGVPPGEPHLVPQSDGAVCEQQMEHIRALYDCRHRDGIEYYAADIEFVMNAACRMNDCNRANDCKRTNDCNLTNDCCRTDNKKNIYGNEDYNL